MRRIFNNCPKCGEDDPTINYISRRWSTCGTAEGHDGEHFHVKCYRCDYRWIEPFKLAKPTDVSDSLEDEFPIIAGVGRMAPILPPRKYKLSNKEDTRITNG